MSRVLNVARGTVVTIAAVLGAATIAVVVICLVAGVRPAIVISGSMEPTIPTGSLTFARSVPASSVGVGDVVTVPRAIGKGLVTHRIVATEHVDGATELTLRGDANASDDPLPYRVRTVGEVVAHVPVLGTIAGLLRTPFGITAIVVLVVAFLVFGIRRRDADTAASVDGDDDDATRTDSSDVRTRDGAH